MAARAVLAVVLYFCFMGNVVLDEKQINADYPTLPNRENNVVCFRYSIGLAASVSLSVPSITIDFTVNYADLGGHCDYNAYYNAIF